MPGIGIVPGMSSEYSVVMESPIYSFDCDSTDCASVGSGSDVGIVERYVAFAKDTAAIAGRTALAPPFSELFPSLDGKWRDFWSGGDEFGDDAEADSVGAVDLRHRRGPGRQPGHALLRVLAHHPHACALERRSRRAPDLPVAGADRPGCPHGRQ